MDILTQGVLGAAMASGAAPRGELRAAAVTGFAAGLVADADALIRSGGDPLVTLEYHRHFTHALAFIPLGALTAAVLLSPFLVRRLGFPRLYLYALLGYALSGVLDAFTSYGTHLLWPFSDVRVALNLVSIVDPLFTLALLVPLAFALIRRRNAFARAGLVLGALYLGAAGLQQQRAHEALLALAKARGHETERILVKPTFANIVLWRGLYVSGGTVHAAGIRAGSDVRVYPGESADLATEPGTDAEARFAALSDGWVVHHPEAPRRLGDARFAMLPTSLRPLWGIEPAAGGGVAFVTDRQLTREERARFTDMLLGREAALP